MKSSHVVEQWSPPTLLQLAWDFPGETPSRVAFHLDARGDANTLVTVEHRGLDDPISYAAGWHRHLTYLVSHLTGQDLAWESFWDGFDVLADKYRMGTEGADGWQRMIDLPRVQAGRLSLCSVPRLPGVYAWFHQGTAIYAGRAGGRGGLRARLRTHLSHGMDLSRSSLRRNVADHLLGVPTSVTRQRPTVMSVDQVDRVNAWIRRLDVAWHELENAEAAKTYERRLLAEWLPPLSRR